MLIYVMFLALAFATWFLSAYKYRVVTINGYQEQRSFGFMGLVFFGVLTVFCGLRSGIADTGAYIHEFNNYPNAISEIVWSDAGKGKGFYLFSVLYKQFISKDYHGWLFIIALVSCIAVAIALRKYACSFGFSCFLFIATTTFTYLVNGIRQFICISILFAITSYIVERKFLKYVIWVLVLSTVHSSALIMIPIYFLCRIKPFSRNTWIILIGALGVGLSFNYIIPVMESVLEDTAYSGYADLMASGVGVNIIRVAIAAVPVILAFMGRHIIAKRNNPIISIATNMSVFTLALYFIALFTNGMAVGRLLAYFDIYNIILLPWLITHIFEERSKKLVTIMAVGAYLLFFYYQMVITWRLPYESDIFNLFLY